MSFSQIKDNSIDVFINKQLKNKMKANEVLGKAKSNMVGTIVGAGAGYLVAKKAVKTTKTWVTVLITVGGAIAGAMAQASMKAKTVKQ